MHPTALADARVAEGINATEHSMQSPERYRVIDGAVTHPKGSHLRSSDHSVLGTGKLRDSLVRSAATFP